MLKIFEVRSEYFEAMVAFNPPKKIILPADASPSALVAQLSIMSSLDGSSSILKQTQKKSELAGSDCRFVQAIS